MAGYNHEDDDLDDLQDFALDGEDEAAEGANILMVVVVSLLFLTAFGCVVWVAYNNGVAHGRDEVLTKTAVATLPPDVPGKAGKSADKSGEVARLVAKSMQNAHKAAPSAAPKPVAPAKPLVKPVAKAAPKPVAKAPAHKIQSKAAPKPVAHAPAQKPHAKAASAGKYTLQVGSFPSAAEAESAWKKFYRKQHALLSGAPHHIEKADLGHKGTWYRLHVGAFPSKDAARALCHKVKANGGACFLTH